jgi:hypothetical protein
VPKRTRHRFVLNTRTGLLHDMDGAAAECHVTDIAKRWRFSTDDGHEAHTHLAFRRECRVCTPRSRKMHRILTIPNPFLSAEPDAPAPS